MTANIVGAQVSDKYHDTLDLSISKLLSEMKKDREEQRRLMEGLMKKCERTTQSVHHGMEHVSSWGPGNVGGKFALQPGKRRRTEPKGLSSVPRRYQRPSYPRAGTLRGSEDRLGLYISSKVEGVDVKFLVDTGSNITILSPAVMEKISVPRRPVLQKVENRMILADGSAKPFRGKGTFELEV